MEEPMKFYELALIASVAVMSCQTPKPPSLSSACQPGELLFTGPDKHFPSYACNGFTGRWMKLTENTGVTPFAGVKGVNP
jgi:hypothetical protein